MRRPDVTEVREGLERVVELRRGFNALDHVRQVLFQRGVFWGLNLGGRVARRVLGPHHLFPHCLLGVVVVVVVVVLASTGTVCGG